MGAMVGACGRRSRPGSRPTLRPNKRLYYVRSCPHPIKHPMWQITPLEIELARRSWQHLPELQKCWRR